MKVPFSPPEITEKDIQAVTEVLKSGWITTGAVTQRFEDEIIAFTNSAGCVCLSSATAALEIALRVLGIGSGDEVIIPAYTYAATANAVIRVGAIPVPADCPENGYNIDSSSILPHINKNTKAVIGVDIGGIMCDYSQIVNGLKDYGSFSPNNEVAAAIGRIAVIADAAHSFGASMAGTNSSSAADFTAFSFHAVKNLTTAEGGALCWRSIGGISDGDIDRNIRLWSLHGQTKSAFDKSKPGNWQYDIELAGCKYNMTDIQAALGLSQLERYTDTLKKRGEDCRLYAEILGQDCNIINHFSPIGSSSCHLIMIDTALGENARNRIIIGLAEEGISANVHFRPLPLFTAYNYLGWDIRNFKNAYKMYSGEISLPLFNTISSSQIEYTALSFKKLFKEVSVVEY